MLRLTHPTFSLGHLTFFIYIWRERQWWDRVRDKIMVRCTNLDSHIWNWWLNLEGLSPGMWNVMPYYIKSFNISHNFKSNSWDLWSSPSHQLLVSWCAHTRAYTFIEIFRWKVTLMKVVRRNPCNIHIYDPTVWCTPTHNMVVKC